MRLRATRNGFWLSLRRGAWVLHPWRALACFVAFPLLLLVATALALHRESNYLRMLWRFVRTGDRESLKDGASLFVAAERAGLENALLMDRPPASSALPDVELFVQENTLDAMFRANQTGDAKLGHEPGGDQPWFNALVREPGGDWCRSEIAYRGAFNWHHWPVKPSLRVKIKKDDVWNSFRFVELSRPKDVLALKHRLPEILAAQLGLMTARTDVVRLFVNRKPFGVYQRSRRPDEPLALAHDRMPGTFFKGDAVQEKAGVDLWAGVASWDTFGEATPEDLAAFDRFLALLREPRTAATLDRFERILDLEGYAKWAAVMAFTGCCHTDLHHNHTYFLCPNQGRIEALPWDPTCFEEAGRPFLPIDMAMHPIMQFALCDPRWVQARDEWLAQLLDRVDLDALIDREVDRALPDLRSDPQLSDLVQGQFRMPESVLDLEPHRAALHAWAREKRAFVATALADARCAVQAIDAAPWRTLVTVDGRVAVRARRKDGAELVGEGERGGTLTLWPGLTEALTRTAFDAGGATVTIPHPEPAPLEYRLAAAPEELIFENAITGAAVGAARRDVAAASGPATRSLHPWQRLQPATCEVTLGPGEVVLESDLHVGELQTLRIVAGTTIRLAAGVGLYSSGRTLVQGTADAPVLMRPCGGLPFACFAVSGAASAGTRFEHLDVEGGTLGSDGVRRFKGMVNVYDCPDLVIRHCRFGRNRESDDAVNLAQSDFLVEESLFEFANADALDLDMSRGSVRRCTFRDSGNDGLDMMTCRVHVLDCRFERCGDKAMSVGEETRLLADRCVGEHCVKGMELKDGSRAVVRDSRLVGCGMGVHAYQKKWVYSRAGVGLFVDTAVRESETFDFSIEKRGAVRLLRSPRGRVDPTTEERVLTVDGPDPESTALITELEAGAGR